MYLAGTGLENLLQQDRNTQPGTSDTIRFLKRENTFKIPKGARTADKTEGSRKYDSFAFTYSKKV